MIKNYSEAQKFLFDHIPGEKFMFQGDTGFERSKKFLESLGNPQNKFKSIHVAGTSAKGSTSFLISKILHSQNFKVGLFISPHIIDFRERIQLNNEFISKDEFVSVMNHIYPKVRRFEEKNGMVTFFEILAAMAFTFFDLKKVDYAVIETGMGGLLDTTNTITRLDKINVITQIGFDHTKFLGETIEEIATQKIGIVHEGQEVITFDQEYPQALSVFEKQVSKINAKLQVVSKNSYKVINSSENGSIFDFNFNGLSLKRLKLSLIGEYQVQNCSLAIGVIIAVSQKDKWEIENELLLKSLKNLRFPGRFEIINKFDSKIVIDGAHNEQKMKGFLSSLKKIFGDEKFTFIIGFKKDKDTKSMLKMIIPHAKKIIISEFKSLSQDIIHTSIDKEEIQAELEEIGFLNIELANSIDQIIKIMKTKPDKYIITGSLYLVSEFYNSNFIENK